MNILNIVSAVIISYLIGSIPTSFIIAKLLKGIDIREYGSGNVGATNLMRVAGKAPGIAALLIDVIKGIIPVIIISHIFYKPNPYISVPSFKIILGVSAISGHIWTIFLRFKGGKGVATTIGVFLGLAPLAMAGALIIWLIVALISRYVSISSIIMAASLPLLLYIFGHPPEYIVFSTAVFFVILYSHRSNIKRIIDRREYKIGQRKLKM